MKEESLEARYLSRALDYCDAPFTKTKLIERCKSEIKYYGPDALISIRMKGVRGRGLKKHRRLIPNGPLGEIKSAYQGRLTIEFTAAQLLDVISGTHDRIASLAHYFTERAEPAYKGSVNLELAMKFAHENLAVELDEDAVAAVLKQNPPNVLGNAYSVIMELLYVEQSALALKWKRVELAKWIAAKQSWPLVPFVSDRKRPATPKPVEGVLYRISERQAKLLRLFDRADETGKEQIEQAAQTVAS